MDHEYSEGDASIMKWIYNSMMALAVMACLTGCKDDGAAPVTPEPEEPAVTAEELLADIPGVTILQTTKDADGEEITVFNFEQPIDHTDASAGTFQQYCVLHYKGPDHVTVLHTQGYSTKDPDKFRKLDLAKNLDANLIEVEHRYYKHSLINFEEEVTDCTGDYWKVNTAAQSTADLHAIVTALKATNCFRGKWVSSGFSKNGMLTSFYAYYYPNEMDVYVPFCAPFCTSEEDPRVGEWVTRRSGMDNGQDTELRRQIWAAFYRMIRDEGLREEISAIDNLTRQKNNTVESSMNYVLNEFMRNLFFKFCYYNTDQWDDVIPLEESHHSAEIYYRFATLGGYEFEKKLKELREVMGLELEEIDRDDDDDESLMLDMEDGMIEDDEMRVASRRAAKTLKKDSLLQVIYPAHAAKELGHFVFDWSVLPDDYPEKDVKWLKEQYSIIPYNKKYQVVYDGGKLMNGFLDFVKNNRNKDKCKMLFIYGSNDPWTGVAIPDPAPDDPYVKKHIVPGGVHGDALNEPTKYPEAEKDWIVNTVKEMLAGS